MLKYVTIAKFSELSGYSEKAIRRKIEDDVWLEGDIWVKTEDSRIQINTQRYEKWVEASSKRQRAA